MAYGVIYLITNKLNGMQYVGQTTRPLKERINNHKHGDQYIDRAIRKYGLENFTVEVIEEYDTLEQLNDRERFWIAALKTRYPNGYNITDGGEGTPGLKYTEERRAQLSLERSGENNAFFGKNHTDDTCFTLSVSHRKETIYNNLRNEMDALRMTATTLAELLGVSVTNLTAKMRGVYGFTYKNKVRLEEIFHKPAEYLLQLDEFAVVKPKKVYQTPFNNLLDELIRLGLSYRSLAPVLGVSESAVSLKMRGKQKFTAEQKKLLEEFFNKPIDYLLQRDDEPVEEPLKRNFAHSLTLRGNTPFMNLRFEMDARQMTITDLGKVLGIFQATASDRVLGKRKFTAEQKKLLEEFFNKPISYLLQRDED